MEHIQINSIALAEDRQRQHFSEGSIIDLADDIERIGLMHPIVLRNDEDVLVAGERRLRAITLLNDANRQLEFNGIPVDPGFIPAVRLSDRHEVDYVEAELYENISRVNLTWKEESQARAKLHRLRFEQSPQTYQETARELTERTNKPVYSSTISEDIRIIEHLDDPQIAKAKTRTDALKLIDKKVLDERNRELAAEWKGAQEKECQHRIHQGDADALLPMLPADTFDVLITDPPYGIDAHSFGDQTRVNHDYDDSFETWVSLMSMLARQSMRITAPNAHAYVFCDISRFYQLAAIFEGSGWDVWARPLIWYKGNVGTLPRPDHGPRYTYECILYAIKGNRRTEQTGAHDVIHVPATQKPRHAAEKPVGLYTALLGRSTKPGDRIIDPFCGSGTVFPAANYLHLTATGIEFDEAAFGLAVSRLEEKYE